MPSNNHFNPSITRIQFEVLQNEAANHQTEEAENVSDVETTGRFIDQQKHFGNFSENQ